jgi:hypothetical protein
MAWILVAWFAVQLAYNIYLANKAYRESGGPYERLASVIFAVFATLLYGALAGIAYSLR